MMMIVMKMRRVCNPVAIMQPLIEPKSPGRGRKVAGMFYSVKGR